MLVRTPIQVRYAETDMMGVVYHANYLLYFEDARTHFLETIGFPYKRIEECGVMCPVYDVHMTYGSPLRYGEEAYVLTQVVENRATKTTYRQRVYREGMDPAADKPCVDALITACMVERGTFKPVSIKRVLPELLARYDEIIAEQDAAQDQ